MPITVTNKTFADEFNSGTTTSLTNANVGDIWTATIDVDYSAILDASNGGSARINAVTPVAYSTKQGFEIVDPQLILTSGFNYSTQDVLSELNNSVEFTMSGYSAGGLNTAFTVLTITSNSSGNPVIVCNEALVTTENGNSARLAITEDIKGGNENEMVASCFGGLFAGGFFLTLGLILTRRAGESG